MINKAVLFALFFTTTFFTSLIAHSNPIDITVAGTVNQPPYVLKEGGGLSQDICDALNEIQGEYRFTFQPLPSTRARDQINRGQIDMIAMANIAWSYDQQVVSHSTNLLYVEDKFFALHRVAHDQSYFDKVGQEPTVVVNGFRYNFLNFESDQSTLRQQYNTSTVNDELGVMKMILNQYANIGVLSSISLRYHQSLYPAQAKELLISDKSDSQYYRHFLINKHAPISIDRFNNLIQQLSRSGKLQQVFARYNLVPAQL